MGEAKRRKEVGLMPRVDRPLVTKEGVNAIGAPRVGDQFSPHLKTAENPGDIFTHIKGKTVVAFLQEVLDCCSEKCIVEYTPYFTKDNMAILMVPKPSYTDILKYLAHIVVYFRMGSKEEGDPSITQSILQYMQHLTGLGLRQVYYVDDLLFYANKKAPLAFISQCDAIIAANDILKDVLVNTLKVPQPVIVVPTHIDLTTFDAAPPIVDLSRDRLKILLTSQGRIGINHLYEMCEIINQDPSMYKDIELVISANGVAQVRSVINRFRNIKKFYLDWMPLTTYYRMCKSVDVILHPAKNEDLAYMCPPELQQLWLDSKCEVKYTLAGAAKIPIISSPVYSYRMAIKDGQNGFLASTAEEFVEKIRMLKDNSDLRKRIGLKAREDVEQNYDVKQRYPLYRDAILGVLDSKANSLPSIAKSGKKKYLFIPPIEGGPRTFFENMKRWLPKVTNQDWEVTTILENAHAAMSIAFVMADSILLEKRKRPDLKIIYRLDGLPTTFTGEIDPNHLAKMQEIFQVADKFVWQSNHCQRMWREGKYIPEGISADGSVIHNGVDLNIFSMSGPLYTPIVNYHDCFLNLNWSTFPHKRLDLLKQMIEKYSINPNVQFVLLGNYKDTNQIHNMQYWKDYKNVTYMGVMRNQTEEAKRMLASIYRSATALIFTSEMEGSPNIILEALGCGCPVIYNAGTDIVPEILGDYCIPLDDSDMIFNEGYRQELKNAMSQIAPAYSIEECIKRYVAILED